MYKTNLLQFKLANQYGDTRKGNDYMFIVKNDKSFIPGLSAGIDDDAENAYIYYVAIIDMKVLNTMRKDKEIDTFDDEAPYFNYLYNEDEGRPLRNKTPDQLVNEIKQYKAPEIRS